MANHILSGSTVGGTVSTITLPWYTSIEIVNRSSGDMWARVDNVDPTIAGDDCHFVAPQGFIQVRNPLVPPNPAEGVTSSSIIKLITAATANYTVSAGV